MENKFCWRCRMEVPMLNKEEFKIASDLYSKGIRQMIPDRQIRFKELLDYYNELTGFGETEPDAIMHHSIELLGPDCEKCGKPYRTPKAKLCPECGNKREF